MINDSIEYLIEKSFEEFEEKMELKGMVITEFNDIINEVKDEIKKEWEWYLKVRGSLTSHLIYLRLKKVKKNTKE